MKNILVVEDDKLTKDFYNIIFKRSGYNPIIVEDVEKIFEVLDKLEISLIIMDINLKNTYFSGEKYDGLKLSSLIKKDLRFSHIPIIIVTAYMPSVVEEEGQNKFRIDGFLNKPIADFSLLINKVNQLILQWAIKYL